MTFFTEAARLKPGNVPMVIENSILTVDYAFSVVTGSSTTLTLVLSHAGTSGEPEPVFRPVIEIEGENQRPTGRLVYVANENSMNVSVIDKDIKRVVYNVFLGARPTAIGADKIILLDNGRISDVGNHAELMDRSELYREIVESQLGPIEEIASLLASR